MDALGIWFAPQMMFLLAAEQTADCFLCACKWRMNLLRLLISRISALIFWKVAWRAVMSQNAMLQRLKISFTHRMQLFLQVVYWLQYGLVFLTVLGGCIKTRWRPCNQEMNSIMSSVWVQWEGSYFQYDLIPFYNQYEEWLWPAGGSWHTGYSLILHNYSVICWWCTFF